jgi:hypothetical protein
MWIQTNENGLINTNAIEQIEHPLIVGRELFTLTLTMVSGRQIALNFDSEELCRGVLNGLVKELKPMDIGDLPSAHLR